MSHSSNILFFDLEVQPKSKKILEYGAILNNQQYRGPQKDKFEELAIQADVICGHNIISHDLTILEDHCFLPSFFRKPKIDTLYLSVLLFPKKPYHHLVKDYYLDNSEMNNPLADSELTKLLFWDLLEAYQRLSLELRTTYYNLLKEEAGFDGFFRSISKEAINVLSSTEELAKYINEHFSNLYCREVDLEELIKTKPIELAFSLAIISVDDSESLLPVWVQHQFPETLEVLNDLRIACLGNKGCPYCQYLSPKKGLQ